MTFDVGGSAAAGTMDEAVRRPWERALEFVLSEGIAPGTTYRKEDLYAAMGLTCPTARTPFGIAQRSQLAFLSGIEALRPELLARHRVDLVTRAGTGYEVIAPGAQSAMAMRDLRRDLSRDINSAARRVEFVKVEALDEGQRRERSDALAKVASIRAMQETARGRSRI